jgi:23S rRNA (uracil1939-C5)-methyltransferase
MMQDRGRKPPVTFEVTIEKLVYGGAGLGRHAGKVVFAPFAAPGDRLLVQAVIQKKNYTRAALVRILEEGEGRAAPFCAHFGRCGGCQWQHIEYALQIEAKRKILEELIHHRFPETRSLPIEMKACPQPHGYRSRARIQTRGFGEHASVGFYRFESHAIEDISGCPLFRPLLNDALASVRESRRSGTTDPGTLEFELACSQEENRWSASEAVPDVPEDFSDLGKQTEDAAQENLLKRTVAGFEYGLSPSVFFQANDFLLEDLVSTVNGLAAESGTGTVLDLFSGVGLFSLPLARRFREVVAVESSLQACMFCERNAAAAGFDNIRVVRAEAASGMRSVSSLAPPAFDLVILDPPRSGAGADLMDLLTQWAPETVIYVSCDPQTLSRDIALLPSRDYQIDFVQGLDLFPQTYHFETVVRLKRRRP